MEYGSYSTDIDEPTTMDHPSWTTRVFGHLQGEYCEETHSVIIDASGQGAACSVGKVYNEAQRVVSDLAFVMVTYLDGPVQLAVQVAAMTRLILLLTAAVPAVSRHGLSSQALHLSLTPMSSGQAGSAASRAARNNSNLPQPERPADGEGVGHRALADRTG